MKRIIASCIAIIMTASACQSQSNFKEPTVFKNDNVEIRQLDEHTWHGNGHRVYNESIYLIEGEKSAILIDAGTYMPGLRKVVEDIVKKPVTLILSHGHGDHIGAMEEWDEIWMNAADEVLLSDKAYKGKKHYLTDGQKFDLGGRTIEVVFTPGHTPGSTTFLDAKSHYGFSSDAFGSGNLLVFTDLSTELASSQRLTRFIEKYDIKYLYPGHYWGDNLETPQRVKDVGTICESILDGTMKPNAKSNNPSLPYIVEQSGVKINYGEAQIR
ncbi:MAG: MBL fold metallo-hydrolase [Bacteroidales bacterium]|nr:MBL fold metallo-hydrolase [Bacteroidales bacterium]